MTAYLIVEATITDPEKYARYRELAGASLEAAGAHYLVRGGATEVLEGEWNPERVVVGEFENPAAARAWYDGPGYVAAREARRGAATMNMVIVEGVG
jgi:uncharacterized protein (DUF1330 family)